MSIETRIFIMHLRRDLTIQKVSVSQVTKHIRTWHHRNWHLPDNLMFGARASKQYIGSTLSEDIMTYLGISLPRTAAQTQVFISLSVGKLNHFSSKLPHRNSTCRQKQREKKSSSSFRLPELINYSLQAARSKLGSSSLLTEFELAR
ncbi:hypothetical protein M9H77_34697 [Catharanthus roseus]|uniref:Uncharacterized protein n=1 Tax=Catharanthus roseus TaxID=4058 RepID=A0ACB9ZR50_CATRO|nr:hypothetical protein M9H77_34697 [Catharanthus roseus]